MTNKIILGYWGIRGLGQVSRLLLAYTGANWEDHPYATREDWFDKDKQTLGLSFPNLPYLIDGDFKLTESSAINRYIIHRSDKKDLLGKNPHDQAIVDMLLGAYTDVRTAVGGLFFNPDWEKAKDAVLEKIKPKLDQMQAFIGNKDFAMGYLTLVDFAIAESSHALEKIFPQEYKKYQFSSRIRHNFEELPQIKAYYQQPTAIKGPFLPPTAAVKM